MMSFPEMIRNVTVVGHLHHGRRISWYEMLTDWCVVLFPRKESRTSNECCTCRYDVQTPIFCHESGKSP